MRPSKSHRRYLRDQRQEYASLCAAADVNPNTDLQDSVKRSFASLILGIVIATNVFMPSIAIAEDAETFEAGGDFAEEVVEENLESADDSPTSDTDDTSTSTELTEGEEVAEDVEAEENTED